MSTLQILLFPQVKEAAFRSVEFGEAAGFEHTPVLDDDNPIHLFDRRQSMRDHDRRDTSEERV